MIYFIWNYPGKKLVKWKQRIPELMTTINKAVINSGHHVDLMAEPETNETLKKKNYTEKSSIYF